MNTYRAVAAALIANRPFCWLGTPQQQQRWMQQAELATVDLQHVPRVVVLDSTGILHRLGSET